MPGAVVTAWAINSHTVYRSLGLHPNTHMLPGNLDDENTIKNINRETSPRRKYEF